MPKFSRLHVAALLHVDYSFSHFPYLCSRPHSAASQSGHRFQVLTPNPLVGPPISLLFSSRLCILAGRIQPQRVKFNASNIHMESIPHYLHPQDVTGISKPFLFPLRLLFLYLRFHQTKKRQFQLHSHPLMTLLTTPFQFLTCVI
jgi:hypothetical protein